MRACLICGDFLDRVTGKYCSRACFYQGLTVHGFSRGRDRTYRSWTEMRQRCTNPTCHKWKDYGARGIKICERWGEFPNFLSDMGERPLGKTLDRIDNNGNYEPSNCRWATPLQQGNNQRTNDLLTFNGSTKALTEWSRILNINQQTLWARLYRYGWDLQRAFMAPIGPQGRRHS